MLVEEDVFGLSKSYKSYTKARPLGSMILIVAAFVFKYIPVQYSMCPLSTCDDQVLVANFEDFKPKTNDIRCSLIIFILHVEIIILIC